MFRTLALIATTALMAGCAAQTHLNPPSNDDPANPQAPEAPVTSITEPLTLEPPPGAASDTGSPAGRPMQHMDMREMPGTSHGQMPAPTQPGQTAPDMEEMHHHSHSGPATRHATLVYTCRMHLQIASDHPGNCPICGMKLVEKTTPTREEMNK